MIANDRSAIVATAVVAMVAMVANNRLRIPSTFHPHVAIAAAIPTALVIDVPGAMSLVVAVVPYPATTVADPPPFDVDKAGTDFDRGDPRRGRLFFDFHHSHRCGHVAMGPDHATRDGQ